jgi:hypothetical protein
LGERCKRLRRGERDGKGDPAEPAPNGTMPKEVVSVRLERNERADLEKLARGNGRTVSEELHLSIVEHLSRSWTVLVPVPPSVVNDGSGRALALSPDQADELLRLFVRNEVVRSVPPELNPALTVILPTWEDWIEADAHFPDTDSVARWIEDRVRTMVRVAPADDALRSLGVAGLVPGSAGYDGRLHRLAFHLWADLGRRRAFEEFIRRVGAERVGDEAEFAEITRRFLPNRDEGSGSPPGSEGAAP